MSGKRRSLHYKQTAPIGIGRTRAEEQADLTAHEREHRALVKAYIWATRPSCQVCHGRRVAECLGLPDEMHEDPSRAETRGKPPEERFNLIVCGRLCARCHRDVTAHILTLVLDPCLGFLAPVTVQQ